MKLDKEFVFFTYLLESCAQSKGITASEILQKLDEKGFIQFVYDSYFIYHQEAIENAIMDIDHLLLTGKPAY